MNDRFGSGAGVLCKVCGDRASGKHYGVPSCDGCRGFFKRSIRRNLEYVCKEGGKCVVDVSRRNQCQACRFSKCLEANMRREAVQHERAPKMTSVTSSTHGLSYAASMYAPRHQDGVFPFPMHFSTVAHPFDNYYMPSPYYPHLTESLNIKLSHGTYKPLLMTPSSYEMEIGKILTNNLMAKTTPNFDPLSRVTKEKENEVTSSEELPLMSDSFRMKTTQSLYDSATKLLFLSIRWAKSIPSFNQLPVQDQKSLLSNSWAELFIVAASQWELSIDAETVASFPFLRHVQNVFESFKSLKIDNFEAACLKALILFRDDTLELGQTNPSQQHILLLQNQSLCLLLEKCNGMRFGHLLLLLPQIKFCGNIKRLQESLFKHTVGEVLIEKILDDSL